MRFEKGDIITYSNGNKKCVNRPDRYEKYFDDDYCNPIYHLKIVKVQRYKKILGFYILKTIYSRSRWI